MEIFFPGRHNTKLHPIQKVLTNTHLESIPPKQCANSSNCSSSSCGGGDEQQLVVVYKNAPTRKKKTSKSTRTYKLQGDKEGSAVDKQYPAVSMLLVRRLYMQALCLPTKDLGSILNKKCSILPISCLANWKECPCILSVQVKPSQKTCLSLD